MHGWTADRLGDSTARERGRLTLNPIKHIDPLGTIVLPAMLVVIHSPVILGWAKPVPVNFARLRNPKKDMIWVGLSGPATNIVLAIIFGQFLRNNIFPSSQFVFQMAVFINLVLAVFNLLPIPPLDGSRFVMGILPVRYARVYAGLEKYGIIIIFLLLYFGVLGRVVWPLVSTLAVYLGVQ